MGFNSGFKGLKENSSCTATEGVVKQTKGSLCSVTVLSWSCQRLLHSLIAFQRSSKTRA